MAFEPKKKQLSKALQETLKEDKTPSAVEAFERTKQYQFTLQPSVREKIDNLAKEKGYRSASSFINDYFKKI